MLAEFSPQPIQRSMLYLFKYTSYILSDDTDKNELKAAEQAVDDHRRRPALYGLAQDITVNDMQDQWQAQ